MNNKIHVSAPLELQEFLPEYLEKRKIDLKTLENALKQGDLKTIQTISHKIRGHALSYGFGPLSQICSKIEMACDKNNFELIEPLLVEFKIYIGSIESN